MKAALRFSLIFLLIFNAIGAYYGSFMLITDPTGVAIKLPPDMLRGAPFQDYFLPGIILFFANGILPTLAAIGLLRNRRLKPLPYFPYLKNYHWGWSLALLSGMVLLGWMVVQLVLLGYYSEFPIQAIMMVIGGLMTVLALSPSLRSLYKIAE